MVILTVDALVAHQTTSALTTNFIITTDNQNFEHCSSVKF